MLLNRNLQKQDIASFCCSKGLFHEISLLNKFDFGMEKKSAKYKRIRGCFRAYRLKTCVPFLKSIITFVSETFSMSRLF